jgi:hypothetical protein
MEDRAAAAARIREAQIKEAQARRMFWMTVAGSALCGLCVGYFFGTGIVSISSLFGLVSSVFLGPITTTVSALE